MGRDEASTAQESQPQPEVVSEVTLESTPQALPVTTPVLKVSDEEDGAVDADYEADMIATQST